MSLSIGGRTCTGNNWFEFSYNPSFLGKTFNRPVHWLLIKQLRVAELHLLNSQRFVGDSIVEMGSKLGLSSATSKHPGGRLDSTSMHAFGLAADIDAFGNPWIGAAFLKSDSPTRARENKRMFEVFKKASGDSLPGGGVTQYLDHISRTYGSDTNAVYNILKRRNDEFIAYLKTHSSELSFWKSSATFGKRNPLKGFLNLDSDLVFALRQVAGLAWGAIDFGGRASGDVMHFDLRTIGIGKTINLKKSKPGSDVPASHPYNVKTGNGKSDEEILDATFTNETEEIDYQEEFTDEHNETGSSFDYEEENYLENETVDSPEEREDYYEQTEPEESEAIRFVSGAASNQPKAFMTVIAQAQGLIKGGVTQKGREGAIAIYGFQHELTSPRDAASGQARRRRQHGTIKILKEVDPASVKLLHAFGTNEKMKEIKLSFWEINFQGKDMLYFPKSCLDRRYLSSGAKKFKFRGKEGNRKD